MDPTYWPFFGLRLATADLELLPTTEDDVGPLAGLVPDDLEIDPRATRYPAIDDERVQRGIVVHQEYWRAYGTWRLESWRLQFTVWHGGERIGVQALEGDDFRELRTVDTFSWLVAEARGRGLGRQMRVAVLALAFGPMDAEAAITSAWHDNHPSLGVSRALGYQPNGESRHAHGDRVDRMVHLRLVRADWLASGRGADVIIDGFDPCRPLLGLDTR
ncbi:MAG: GNAT family N-acetyltransferase [Actinomycetota bacterium]|nr:GNAT family N-acetyltransferase [Actinomycetota bacterium]